MFGTLLAMVVGIGLYKVYVRATENPGQTVEWAQTIRRIFRNL